MRLFSKVWLFVGPVVMVGCGGSEPSSDSGKATPAVASSQSQGLWACDAKSKRVTCTAPVTNAMPSHAFYSCASKDGSSTCPDSASIAKVAALAPLLQNPAAATAFAAAPWACLMTGKEQMQCSRDVASLPSGSAGSSDGTSSPQPPAADGTSNTGGSTPGGSTPGGSGIPGLPGGIPGLPGAPSGSSGGAPSSGASGATQPPPPSSCDLHAWEAYFAQLASFEYQSHGVDITFPVNIFDATQSMAEVGLGAGSTKVTPGAPSCHDGEWEMRQQAWIDAVSDGCMSLNNVIATLCQQAANYAPSTCKCNMTGSW